MSEQRFYHYTDEDGYKAIHSQPIWTFKAKQPPANHPLGAYFTTLAPDTPMLAQRLRVPTTKIQWVFAFTGGEGLRPLKGGRGRFIFFSPHDYNVDKSRQMFAGRTVDAKV